MHKIDTDTAVGNEFVNGDVETGIRATRLNASWFNTIQRELCNLLEKNGVTLSKGNDQQLYELFENLFKYTIHLIDKHGQSTTCDIDHEQIKFMNPSNRSKYQISSNNGFTYEVDGKIEVQLSEEGLKTKWVTADSTGLRFTSSDGSMNAARIVSIIGQQGTLGDGISVVGGNLHVDSDNGHGGKIIAEDAEFNGNLVVSGRSTFEYQSTFKKQVNLNDLVRFGTTNKTFISNDKLTIHDIATDMQTVSGNQTVVGESKLHNLKLKKTLASEYGDAGTIGIFDIYTGTTASTVNLSGNMGGVTYEPGEIRVFENAHSSGAINFLWKDRNGTDHTTTCKPGQAIMMVVTKRNGTSHSWCIMSPCLDN